MVKARYIMIGGFLGAGKTTAVLALARQLRADGKRAGLITNDQSFGLVDTAMLDQRQLRTLADQVAKAKAKGGRK